MSSAAPKPDRKWLRHASVVGGILVLLNEARGIFVVVTFGVPILKRIWGWE